MARVKAGDEQVRITFIEANLKLVVSSAKRYLIPTCVLSLNSKMREKHHRMKSFFVLGQFRERLAQYFDQLI